MHLLDQPYSRPFYVQRYLLLLIAICLTLGIFFGLPGSYSIPFSTHHAIAPTLAGDIIQVQNATLGFQEIKVISLPKRTDRRDAWTVASSVSNFSVSIADGVDGATISEKALPYTMSQKPGILGCWRAHMNVLQDILKRSISSTLIFEDDADWDVSLKSQLVQFARGSRWILDTPGTSLPHRTPHSPYGDDWDILWFGNCAANADSTDDRRFVIENDPTADPLPLRSYGIGPDNHYWNGTQTRLVFSQSYGVCTTAYAVSLSGARKMLYYLSMSPFNAPIDLGLSDLCKYKNSSFTCVGVWPPLIGVHRPEGKKSASSDIELGDDAVEGAHSERIVFSTRLNMDRLLRGETTFRAANPSFVEREEMELDQIIMPVGYETRVEVDTMDLGR